MTIKEKLHNLVERLPDSELPAAERFLEYLSSRGTAPLERALAEAPEDEEPETQEEMDAVRDARDAAAAGKVISDEELARELGL